MSLFSGLRDKLSALKPDKSKDELTVKLSNIAFTSCHDAVIRSYNVNPPSSHISLTGSDRAVYAVHISPYAPHLLLSGGYDCMVRVWDLRTNTQTMVLDGHKDSIFCLVMLPDGRVVSGSSDKTIRVWNLKSKKCEFSLNAHFGGILGLVHINVGTGYLASCGIDHTVRLWSLQAKSCCCTMQGHSLPVASLALIDETSMLSAGHDGEIKRWRLHLPAPNGSTATRKADLEVSIKAHDKSIHVLCLLPEGRLASAGRDCTIKIWNLSTLHTGVAIMTLNGHTKDINGLAWTADRRLVSGGSDCTVRVWNIDRAAVNGSYCDQTFTSLSAAGAPTVVYAVFAYRSQEELASTSALPPPGGIKRSISKNTIAGSSAQSVVGGSPSIVATPGMATPPQGPQVSAAPLTESQGLRSKGRSRAKLDAAQAATAEAKRLEKQRKAREQEKLRLLEQSRLLEEEVDDEETKRFTSILSLSADPDLPPETLSRVRKYRNAHHLNYHDILKNGWYDDGGLIPGVNAAKVGKERGGVGRWEYDVVVFDSSKDPLLADVIETAKRLVRQQDNVKGRAQILAQLVSNKLGGLPNDIIGAWERVRQKAMKHRAVRQAQMSPEDQANFDTRTIMPIGALIGETGLTRHRACLFKYLCDLTVQNPEEWCYPVDSDGPLSQHNGEDYRGSMPSSPAQSDAPINSSLFGTSDERDVAMPLNRYLDDQNSAASALVTEEVDRPRLRLTRRTSGDSDSSEKDPPLIRAGRSSLSPDELAIHCRLIRGQYQYYVPRSRKNRDTAPLSSPSASLPSPSAQSPQSALDDKNEDERGRERIGGYHAWNVVIINGEHYVVDLIYEPSMLYHESSREALHYNRGRRGTPKQTGLTNLPVRDVREIDYSEFTNIQTLKDGGFGRVERARWGKLDVVIKTPLTTDTYVIKTFIEEARVLNTLNHPNIVQLIGVCSSKKAIILEYINGSDVHQWIRQHRPPSNPNIIPSQPIITLKERLDVLIQSALAMQYLHGCEPPIVHRDLKTLNLLINNVGNYRVIKVCDFGLARNQKNNDGISTQHKDMGTPCLPEHDTRILTNNGFLFLSQLEERIAAGKSVEYACFNVAKQAIVYKPGKIVISPAPHRWVDFTQSASRSHWDESSSQFSSAVSHPRANHLSLRVTPSHRMYIQPGTPHHAEHPLYSSDLAVNAPLSPLKLPASELAPGHRCSCGSRHADSCPHNYAAYSIFTAASNGIECDSPLSLTDTHSSSPISALHLRTDTQLSALFSFYGMWLVSGSIDYVNKGISVHTQSALSRATLLESLRQLDLHEENDWRLHDDHVLIIAPRWFTLFDDEYGTQLRQPEQSDKSKQINQSINATQQVSSVFSWLLTRTSPAHLRVLLDVMQRTSTDILSKTETNINQSIGPLTSSKSIVTSSVQLRDELLQICLHAGYSARFESINQSIDGHWRVLYDTRNTATLLATDVRYDGAPVQSRINQSDSQSIDQSINQSIDTPLSDTYDADRDGRVWCVEVEHCDRLIIVQRAQVDHSQNQSINQSIVTKVGLSMVIGNCFQSPEQWRDDDEERLTEKTDIYSFGGILLEVLTDRIPWFEEKSKYAIYQHVVVEKRGPPIPAIIAFTVPPMLIDLIRWCQAHEPEKRPTFPEILRVLREVDDSLPPD